jgi:hypothetical protein
VYPPCQILFFSSGSTAPLTLASAFKFIIILQTVGLLVRVISPSQGLYLNTGQHKHRINTYTHQTSMPCVGLEPTIPVFNRAKRVHVLDRSATVTGVKFWMPEPIFMKFGVRTIVYERISTAYFINPSHQFLCLYEYPATFARQRLGRQFTAATNTYTNRFVGGVIFHAIHVISK